MAEKATRKPAAPAGWSPRARQVWQAAHRDFELHPAEAELLKMACEALMRCEQASKVLAKSGLTCIDRYGTPRARPEVDVEARSRVFYAAAIRQLGLELAEDAGADAPGVASARAAANARWGRERRVEASRRARGGS
jgi:hypothetical protein